MFILILQFHLHQMSQIPFLNYLKPQPETSTKYFIMSNTPSQIPSMSRKYPPQFTNLMLFKVPCSCPEKFIFKEKVGTTTRMTKEEVEGKDKDHPNPLSYPIMPNTRSRIPGM